MHSAIAALAMVVLADNTIPSGALTVHPMSEREGPKTDLPSRQVPDDGVRLALVSYALPMRSDNSSGALSSMACNFTVNVDQGTTTAGVEERGDGPACAMGDLTVAVEEALARWRFEPVREPRKTSGRYWFKVRVHFDDGETEASVDLARDVLAVRMPSPPYAGLHFVERASPRAQREIGCGLGDMKANCTVHLSLDEKGAPFAVDVRQCSDSDREDVSKAAWGWRFEPQRVNGVPTSSDYTLVILETRFDQECVQCCSDVALLP